MTTTTTPTTTALSPSEAAGQATAAILRDTLHGTARGIVVDSPPAPESPPSWCAPRSNSRTRAAR